MGMQSDKVRLNVGGKLFETSATTLASARRSSMFRSMFDDEWNLQPREVNQEYFIDRDPDCFSVLLNLLRTGELHVPPHVPDKLFYREALYYGLLDHVRTAKICKFDCNWLKLKSSVRDQARDNWTAIRASPDGGCAVTHGGIVRVYDWMLEEHPPLNLGYQSIKDILWIDSENIVISSYQVAGSIGLFSSSTGHLKHKYQYYETDHGVGFAAGALCFNSDGKIFASCSWTNNCGIGVWDQVTGKQTDFFETSDGLQLGDADKIQWLNGRNCLFVSKFQSWREKNYISLLDFRDKSIVWSGTYKYTSGAKTNCLVNVDDAIPVDEGNSVCVASYLHGLGFLDLRRTDISTRWSDLKCIQKNHRYTPKLTFHGGQLFCSMYDKISVYYGGLDQWVLTSSLGRSEGGSIRDFSIGGDRLFALHGEENVFDIWETPSVH
ncbi:hypothetical protein MKW92_010449 [Papaver armeniacum]|nr:hypothetical protein MKW92_010449 [Papaver armeniacum]